MTTEIVVDAEPQTIATRQVQQAVQQSKPSASFGGRGIEIRTVDDVKFLASLAVKTAMPGAGPKGDPTVERAALCVMRAMAMGVDPVGALMRWSWISDKLCPPSDDFIAACKIRRDLCLYFRLVPAECNDTQATWETHRVGEPEPTRLTFTLKDAERAGLLKNENYRRFPLQMLKKRAGAFLARDVYPDLFASTHSDEEVESYTRSDGRADFTAGPVAAKASVSVVPDVDRKIVADLDALGTDTTVSLPVLQGLLDALRGRIMALPDVKRGSERYGLLKAAYDAAKERLAGLAERKAQDDRAEGTTEELT